MYTARATKQARHLTPTEYIRQSVGAKSFDHDIRRIVRRRNASRVKRGCSVKSSYDAIWGYGNMIARENAS